jgi:hypothetical protein
MPVIFIVGVGRSGTTLLMSMLNAHPEIAFLPETHFVSEYIVHRPFLSHKSLRDRLMRDPRVGRLNLPIGDILSSVTGRRPDLRGIYVEVLNRFAERQDVSVVGDKAPRYVECIPVLDALIPDARIIHVIRDPRDVFVSRTQAEWSRGRAGWTHALAYRAQMSMGRHAGAALGADRYLEIRYESLVSEPEEVLRRVSTFLEVAFDPSMLKFQESAREIVSADEIEWKQNVLGPLLTRNAGRWRSTLDPKTARRIEEMCRPVFDEGLYESGAAEREPASVARRLPDAIRRLIRNAAMATASATYRLHRSLQNLIAVRRLG